jgi:hypothetical protein
MLLLFMNESFGEEKVIDEHGAYLWQSGGYIVRSEPCGVCQTLAYMAHRQGPAPLMDVSACGLMVERIVSVERD